MFRMDSKLIAQETCDTTLYFQLCDLFIIQHLKCLHWAFLFRPVKPSHGACSFKVSQSHQRPRRSFFSAPILIINLIALLAAVAETFVFIGLTLSRDFYVLYEATKLCNSYVRFVVFGGLTRRWGWWHSIKLTHSIRTQPSNGLRRQTAKKILI